MSVGSHKTGQLSAEAAVDARENWQEAQARLYQETGQQLKALCIAKVNGQAANDKASEQIAPPDVCLWRAHRGPGDGK